MSEIKTLDKKLNDAEKKIDKAAEESKKKISLFVSFICYKRIESIPAIDLSKLGIDGPGGKGQTIAPPQSMVIPDFEWAVLDGLHYPKNAADLQTITAALMRSYKSEKIVILNFRPLC